MRWAVCATTIACVGLLAGCGSAAPPELATVRASQLPYFFVGESFDGLDLTHVSPYDTQGVAFLIYGTCEASGDGGCAPPLELQHRMCGGRVGIVIYVGAEPKPGRAARAAKALRPLSRGARGMEPKVAFDRAPPC